jgi:hypothetical protein
MPIAKKSAKKTSTRSRAEKSLAPVVEIPKTPVDPQEYYASIDWEDWYHEFATEKLRTGGQPKYASAFEFAKVKGSTRQQRDLILHAIGPVVPGKTPMFRELPQFDWEKRRKAGFWLGPETLKDQLEQITKHTDTLDELRASGQAHILPLLSRVSAMFEKIETSFGGQLFLPGATEKVNEARANLYMRLVDQTTRITILLQEAYRNSLFLNINDMQGTIALRESQIAKASSETDKKSNAHKFLQNVLEMTFEKAEALKLPLPDAEIVDIAAKYTKTG